METQDKFSINVNTYTLIGNTKNKGISNYETNFILPIYLRNYSSNDIEKDIENEIDRFFINNIFSSFRNKRSKSEPEPLFIGILQLNSKNNNINVLIEEQESLITFILFIKLLQTKYPDNEKLKNTKLDWLITLVNIENEQNNLNELLKNEIKFDKESLNIYIKYISIINEHFENQIKEDEEYTEENSEKKFNIEDFSNHLSNYFYFVIFESQVSIIKTIQKMYALGISRLYLHNEDIFKIRLYEYFKDDNQSNANILKEINELYKKKDKNNLNINSILYIYQYLLINENNLNESLYNYDYSTFFERLFDTILDNKQFNDFKEISLKNKLSITVLNNILDSLIEYNNKKDLYENENYRKFLPYRSTHFFYKLPIIFLYVYKNKNENDYWNKMLKFEDLLNKLNTINSILNKNSTNFEHKITNDIINLILSRNYDNLINTLTERINDQNNRNLVNNILYIS